MSDTKAKLLTGALQTLTEHGIAGTSARTIAAACRHGAEQRVALYRDRLAQVSSLSELIDVARDLHTKEKSAGHLAVLGQLLAGAQTQPRLAPATAAGMSLWTEELEVVLTRVLADTPLTEFVDTTGLATAISAGFVGLELYEGVDADGAERALASLEQLAALVGALDDLGPVIQRAVRTRLRRTRKRSEGQD